MSSAWTGQRGQSAKTARTQPADFPGGSSRARRSSVTARSRCTPASPTSSAVSEGSSANAMPTSRRIS
ncbi:MAG: hypothetical protein FWE35_13850 [Streptosporangiales bacterium]|nr:hypothetical protein [Streptosporangiales bacterium]